MVYHLDSSIGELYVRGYPHPYVAIAISFRTTFNIKNEFILVPGHFLLILQLLILLLLLYLLVATI